MEHKPSLYYKYIDQFHLTAVGSIDKAPRMKNRRFKDMYFSNYLQDKQISIDEEWGLTKPNTNAFYKNLAKYQKHSPIDYDTNAKDFAIMCMHHQFHGYLKNSGLESCEDSVARLDLSKSPSFPLNEEYPTKGDLIKHLDLVQMCKEQFKTRLLNPGAVWITGTALKEEVRPMVKLILDKIRLFAPSSADFTVLTSMLCGKFNDNFTACHTVTASAVGINPFYRGWHRLRSKLSKFNNCFEGDYSDFDSSLSSMLLFEVLKFRLFCFPKEELTEDNVLRMYTLYSNLVYSHMLLCDGTIVRKHQGNPSGSANTVVDNTLINYISLAYCWFRLAPDGRRTYNDFNSNVVCTLYGDDNTASVSDAASLFFTPLAIQKCMRELGLFIEFESDDFVSLNEVSFLRSDFHTEMYGTYIYHLDVGKMQTTMLYSEYPTDPVMSLRRACGIRNVTWSDLNSRKFFADYIDWLIAKFDRIMLNDIEWVAAKSGYLTDFELAALYLGLESKRQKDSLPNSPSPSENVGYPFKHFPLLPYYTSPECFHLGPHDCSLHSSSVNCYLFTADAPLPVSRMVRESFEKLNDFMTPLMWYEYSTRVDDKRERVNYWFTLWNICYHREHDDVAQHYTNHKLISVEEIPSGIYVDNELMSHDDYLALRKKNHDYIAIPKQARNRKKKNNQKRKTTTTTTTTVRKPKQKGGGRGAGPRKRYTNRRGKQSNNKQRETGRTTTSRTFTAPANIGTIIRSSKKRRFVRIEHSEPLGYITSSTTPGLFKVDMWRINPGMVQTFQWMWKISQCFDMYRFKSIKIRYVNRVSSARDGVVDIAFDPNSGDVNPTGMAEIQNFAEYAEGAVWRPFSFSIPPKSYMVKDLYVRENGTYPAGEDVKTYDLGKLYIASEGAEAGLKLGDCFIDYVIEFVFPEANNPNPFSPASWNGNFTSSGVFPITGVTSQDGTQGALCQYSDGVIYAPAPGQYGFAYRLNATVGSTITSFGGMQEVNTSAALVNLYSYSATSATGFIVFRTSASGSWVPGVEFKDEVVTGGTWNGGNWFMWRLYWSGSDSSSDLDREFKMFKAWKDSLETDTLLYPQKPDKQALTKIMPAPTVNLDQIPPYVDDRITEEEQSSSEEEIIIERKRKKKANESNTSSPVTRRDLSQPVPQGPK